MMRRREPQVILLATILLFAVIGCGSGSGTLEVADEWRVSWEGRESPDFYTHVRGQATAPDGCEYAAVEFKMLDDDGAVIGNLKDEIQGLDAGDTWKFDAFGPIGGRPDEAELSKTECQ